MNMLRSFVVAGLAWGCLLGASHTQAGTLTLAGGGVRAGFAASQRSDTFNQFEAAGIFRLPWQHTWANGSFLGTELDCSAGILRGLGAESFIAGIGPALVFGPLGAPGHLRAGISATYLGRTELGERDFGFPLQFTSYVGFEIEVGRHVEFGYRFQHMSNAGLGSHNPGLNLHALSLTYRF